MTAGKNEPLPTMQMTLRIAAGQGNLEEVRRLVKTETDRREIEAAYRAAVGKGHLRVVRFFVDGLGVDVNAPNVQAEGYTALDLAIGYERGSRMEQYLRSRGARRSADLSSSEPGPCP